MPVNEEPRGSAARGPFGLPMLQGTAFQLRIVFHFHIWRSKKFASPDVRVGPDPGRTAVPWISEHFGLLPDRNLFSLRRSGPTAEHADPCPRRSSARRCFEQLIHPWVHTTARAVRDDPASAAMRMVFEWKIDFRSRTKETRFA